MSSASIPNDKTARVQLIVPTSINVLTAVNETMLRRQLQGETPSISLPSLRRRALLIVNESAVLAIQNVTVANKA